MRPPGAKNLKPLPVRFDEVRLPSISRRPEHHRGSATGPRPNIIEQMVSKWDPRISNLAQDFVFDVSLMRINENTFFKEYIKPSKAIRFSPLNILYCNYCWNDWPIIGVFAFDRVTMVRFFRGQCCPSCEPREDRRNINQSLMHTGPSHFFIEQAQRLGMRADRFPYVGSEKMGSIRFNDLWLMSAKSRNDAEKWWWLVQDALVETNPDFSADEAGETGKPPPPISSTPTEGGD